MARVRAARGGSPVSEWKREDTSRKCSSSGGAVSSETRAWISSMNRLVVIVPKGNPAGIDKLGDLIKPGVKLDVADPSVPVGDYTLQVLDKLAADPAFGTAFKPGFLARVVSKENNVKQVVSK